MLEMLCKQVSWSDLGSCASWVLSARLASCRLVCSYPGRKKAALHTLHMPQLTHTNLTALSTAGRGTVYILLTTIKVIYSVIPKNSSSVILAMFTSTTGSKILLRQCLYHILIFFCVITWESYFKDWTVNKVHFYMIESVSRQLTIFKLLNNTMLMK